MIVATLYTHVLVNLVQKKVALLSFLELMLLLVQANELKLIKRQQDLVDKAYLHLHWEVQREIIIYKLLVWQYVDQHVCDND